MTMDNWLSRLKRDRTWLAGIAAVVLLALLLMLESRFRTIVNANVGAVSALLTAMLVVLYFGQYQLQSRQIQFQHTPHVEIQEYDTDGKQIEIYLSNLGNGLAKDIEVETCIDFPATDDLTPGCSSIGLRRVGENGDPKRRVGNSLEAGEHNVRFVSEPVTDIRSHKPNGGHGLGAATNRLARDGIDEATFTLFVTSTDLLGSEHRENVFKTPLNVELNSESFSIDEIRRNQKPGGWTDL